MAEPAIVCPKCGFTQPSSPSCQACGVIFAKIRRASTAPAGAGMDSTPAMARTTLGHLLLTPKTYPVAGLLAAAGLWLLLLVYGGQLILAGPASNAAGESLLHLVNLPFHEAGHVFLRPFGPFLASLGGTLGQLAAPLVCGFVLLVQTRDPFGGAVCAWWFGENLLDIAPYINDARAGRLPLVGGNTGHSSPYGFHDWEYLLTETGLLAHDRLLAGLAHGLGALLMLAGLAWGGRLLISAWRRRDRNQAS